VSLDFLAQVACMWEVSARKIGNVHPRASHTDAHLVSFLVSAAALRWAAGRETDERIGHLILRAVQDTQAAVGTNTNLGIILLLAPLIIVDSPTDLPNRLPDCLDRATVHDTRLVYEAIRLANPAGLGVVPDQDVRDEPTVPLREAMKLAANRDLIARQYANGYTDVLDFGVPAFLHAFKKFGRIEPAIIECQLKWLAEYPDSLIARKNGPTVAENIRQRVREVLARGGLDTPNGRRAGVELDRYLRSDGNKLNPGTTADLVTACLFVALRENKVKPGDPFPWDVPDWL
jgi:triphosphoribosyl-dephospho-CoA synthase